MHEVERAGNDVAFLADHQARGGAFAYEQIFHLLAPAERFDADDAGSNVLNCFANRLFLGIGFCGAELELTDDGETDKPAHQTKRRIWVFPSSLSPFPFSPLTSHEVLPPQVPVRVAR